MKKTIFLLCIFCLSLGRLYALEPGSESTSNERKPDKIESRVFSSVGEVVFDQKYGNIQIIESITNEVQLEIRYFYGKNNRIPTCEVQQSGKNLQIRTIESGKDNSKIDYVISVPKNVNMTITTKYGNVEINDFYGIFKLNMGYGNLSAGTFGKEVSIDGKYSNYTINTVGQLTLDSDYSNVTIKKVSKLDAKSKYSNFKISDAGEMSLTASYGKVSLDQVSSLDITLKYTDTTIGKLAKSIEADCSYSNITVKDTGANLESVHITGKYSDISISPDASISAEIKFEARYGNIRISKNWNTEYVNKEETNNTSYRKGTLGKGTPKTKMKITTSYGDINIR